jgi:hypothetical protein
MTLPVDALVVVILAMVFLLGSVINGLVGFGLALVAVNAVATFLDPKSGVVVISLIAPFLSSSQLRYNWAYFHSWSRLRSMVAGAVVGSLLGAQLLVLLPTWAIGIALGVFTVQFTIDRLRRERPQVTQRTERRLAPVAGLIGGTTNSALGASGPIYGSYLYAIGLRGREFAFGISVVFFVQAMVRLFSLIGLGQVTAPLFALALALFLPSFIGQHIGQYLQGRVDPKLFQRVLLAVLLISALNILLQSGRGALAALGVGL